MGLTLNIIRSLVDQAGAEVLGRVTASPTANTVLGRLKDLYDRLGPGPSVLSVGNSSTSVLAGGATFTGTAEDVLGYATIGVLVKASHASAVDGLMLQYSPDGTNWDDSDSFSIPASKGKFFTVPVEGRYFRVAYTNGATLQTSFRLQVMYHTRSPKPSSHRIQDSITDDDDAELVKAVIAAKDQTGTFTNVLATFAGELRTFPGAGSTPFLTGATVNANGTASALTSHGAKEVSILVNCPNAPTGTNPTLAFRMEELDPVNGTTVLRSRTFPTITAAGQYVFTCQTTSSSLRAAWTVGGTTPSFTGVNAAVVSKLGGVPDTAGSGSVGALNATVVTDTRGCSTVIFSISGTFVATLAVEGTVDGTNWFPISGSIVGQENEFVVGFVAAPVLWMVPCGGYVQVRVRAISYVSGTAVAVWNSSPGVSGLQAHNYDPAGFKASVRGIDVSGLASLTAAAQTSLLSVVGISSATFGLYGTWVGTVVFEGTVDGSLWFAINAYTQGSGVVVPSATGNGHYTLQCGGFQKVRVRCSAYTSGTIGVISNGGLGTNPVLTSVQGQLADGAAVSGNPVLIGGQDGTNIQSFLTDTQGRQQIITPARTRVSIVFDSTATATADTLLSLIKRVDGSNPAGATTIAVTASKTLRITAMTFSVKSNAAVTAAFATFTLRINPAGAAVIGSQIEMRVDLGNTEAAVGAGRAITLVFPDGFELTGAHQLAVSVSAQATTNILSVALTGYEYTT